MDAFSFNSVATVRTGRTKKTMRERAVARVYQFAALQFVASTVAAITTELRGEIEGEALTHYAKTGSADRARPPTYRACEDGASAMVELRKRGAVLTDAQVAECDRLGIAYDTTPIAVDAFLLNPDVMTDEVKLVLTTLLNRAIRAGKLPPNLIVHQEGATERTLPHGTLEALFATGDAARIEEALPLVAVLAVGKTGFTGSLRDALGVLDAALAGAVVDAPR